MLTPQQIKKLKEDYQLGVVFLERVTELMTLHGIAIPDGKAETTVTNYAIGRADAEGFTMGPCALGEILEVCGYPGQYIYALSSCGNRTPVFHWDVPGYYWQKL